MARPKIHDPRADSYLPPDIALMKIAFEEGKEIGEPARVSALEKIFAWKAGFLNAWIGFPNDGKSTFFSFMALVKAKIDDWKWCLWTPEMISSHLIDGKVYINADDVYDDLIFMYTGITPYKHWETKYNVKRIGWDDYFNAYEWVRDHFIVIDPSDRTYTSLLDNFKYQFEVNGCKGFLIDPYKNVKKQPEVRTDIWLTDMLTECKRFAQETHSCMNIIAHPRSLTEPKNKDGSFKICTQFMLSDGAAWDQSCDGIYSIYRPERHKDSTDPNVSFYNLKQRKQQLVARTGVYEYITFDFMKNRYYFDGVCPIDGSFYTPKQTEMFVDFQVKKATKNQGYVDMTVPANERAPDNLPF